MSSAAAQIAPPVTGAKITIRDGKLIVPDNPIVPFIEGDGTGPDRRSLVGRLRGEWNDEVDGVRRLAAEWHVSQPEAIRLVNEAAREDGFRAELQSTPPCCPRCAQSLPP